MTNWIEDFWADGNWGARQAERDALADARWRKKQNDEINRIREEFFARVAREDFERLKKETFKKFNGKWHGGPCCPSCEYDYLDCFHCCCNEGDYPLENKDYKVLYPPVNGMLPPEWQYFGPRTRERYIKRFGKELDGIQGLPQPA